MLRAATLLALAATASAFAGGKQNVCRTTGGTGHGGACVFPFTYKHKKYTACTTVDNGHTPWCATSAKGGNGGPWGNCKKSALCKRSTVGQKFMAKLAAKNGVKAGSYTFQRTMPLTRRGTYQSVMIAACKKLHMKPVCDHPSYCKNDKSALYIGQSSHIAYRPYRRNNSYMPKGFSKIENKWIGLCSYTGHANKAYALCNIPTNTHAWRTVQQYSPGFICGMVRGQVTVNSKTYAATLGSKNGVKAMSYKFKKVRAGKSGPYYRIMINACRKYGMKPVCEYPQSCKNDRYSVYLGQSAYLTNPRYRNNNGYVPSGFSHIKTLWKGVCGYVRHNARALCNVPSNSFSWRTPAQYNPGFICAKAGKSSGSGGKNKFYVTLGSKNHVKAARYMFRTIKATSTGGSYSNIMVAACKKVHMKPVCGHPSYCKNDKKSLYIGQSSYLSHPAYRKNNGYVPKGFSRIRNHWNGMCVYTGHAKGNYALCNIPANTHAWRTAPQYNPGFICGKKTSGTVACRDDPRQLRKLVKGATCKKAKNFGMCTSASERSMAKAMCAKTCGLCKKTACRDHSSSCNELIQQCGGGGLVDNTCCATCKKHPNKGRHLHSRGTNGCNRHHRCPACQGDCDSNRDCAKGLRCFQRNKNGVSGSATVPGCAVGGHGDLFGHDYCYKPAH